MQNTNSKRGRPKTKVAWPEGEFTANQAYTENSTKVSRVSIHNKINEALSLGSLIKVRKTKAKIGRPSHVYQASSSVSPDVKRETVEEMDF